MPEGFGNEVYEAFTFLIRTVGQAPFHQKSGYCQQWKARHDDCHGCESFFGCEKMAMLCCLNFVCNEKGVSEKVALDLVDRVLKARTSDELKLIQVEINKLMFG